MCPTCSRSNTPWASTIRLPSRLSAAMVLPSVSRSVTFEPASGKEDETIVPSIAGAAVEPLPVLDAVEALAGQLPVEQVHLLALVAIGFDHHVFRVAPDPFDFL